MTNNKNPGVEGKRLWDSLIEMAKIGATEKGGNCRLALTDLDKEGRNLFIQWCHDAGCSIKVDKMGSIFAHILGCIRSMGHWYTGGIFIMFIQYIRI